MLELEYSFYFYDYDVNPKMCLYLYFTHPVIYFHDFHSINTKNSKNRGKRVKCELFSSIRNSIYQIAKTKTYKWSAVHVHVVIETLFELMVDI